MRVRWLLLCAALRSYQRELMQHPPRQRESTRTETQAETEAQKSEEELISEIEATPDLALTITAGEAFDVRTDFTGLNLKDGETAELKLAEAEDGTKFDVQVPGIYK